MHEAAQADYDTCGLVRPPTLLLKVIFRSSGTGRQQDIQTRLKLNENSSLHHSTVYDDSGRSCEKYCTCSSGQGISKHLAGHSVNPGQAAQSAGSRPKASPVLPSTPNDAQKRSPVRSAGLLKRINSRGVTPHADARRKAVAC